MYIISLWHPIPLVLPLVILFYIVDMIILDMWASIVFFEQSILLIVFTIFIGLLFTSTQ